LAARQRRTAEQSKANILEVAERRLQRYGLEGLTVTAVAQEAGISHATLLHHFGSVDGMREALVDQMFLSLVADMVDAVSAKVPPEQITQRLFDMLSDGGHATLLAWRKIDKTRQRKDEAPMQELFSRLMASATESLDDEAAADLRRLYYLVGCAAIGHGLSGPMLAEGMGMSTAEAASVPGWAIPRLMG
jgi:AcrR family transcriptional regulator